MGKAAEFQKFIDEFESLEARATKAEAELETAREGLRDQLASMLRTEEELNSARLERARANLRADTAEKKLAGEEQRFTTMVDYYEALIEPIRAHFGDGATTAVEDDEPAPASSLNEAMEYLARIRELERQIQTVSARSLRLEKALEAIDPKAARNALVEPRKAAKAPASVKAAPLRSTGLYGALTGEWESVGTIFKRAQHNGYPLKVGSLYVRLAKAHAAGEIERRGEARAYEWRLLHAGDPVDDGLEAQPVNVAEAAPSIEDQIREVMEVRRAPHEGGYWTAANLQRHVKTTGNLFYILQDMAGIGLIERNAKSPGASRKYRLPVSVDASTVPDQVFLDALDHDTPIGEYKLYQMLDASHRLRDVDVLARYRMLDRTGEVSGVYEDKQWWFVLTGEAKPITPTGLDDLLQAIERVTGKNGKGFAS